MNRFSHPFANTTLQGEQWISPGSEQHLLLLHGAGQASRAAYWPLRQFLHQRNIATTAFDFIGHGQTGGDLHGSSLDQRVQQALAIQQHHCPPRPLALLGSSMGSYIALHMLAHMECSHLVLQVPGVYTPAAFKLPFGPAFSHVIRQPDSWADSDAWALLEAFRGHVLIVAAEQDQVIPRQIIERLHASSRQASSCQLLWISGAGHQLGLHWQAHTAAAENYRQAIADFLLWK